MHIFCQNCTSIDLLVQFWSECHHVESNNAQILMMVVSETGIIYDHLNWGNLSPPHFLWSFTHFQRTTQGTILQDIWKICRADWVIQKLICDYCVLFGIKCPRNASTSWQVSKARVKFVRSSHSTCQHCLYHCST